MQRMYSYVPDTNNVSRAYSVSALFYLQFVINLMLFPVLNVLYFYISTFRSVCVCAVPSVAVFCSSLLSCFPRVF